MAEVDLEVSQLRAMPERRFQPLQLGSQLGPWLDASPSPPDSASPSSLLLTAPTLTDAARVSAQEKSRRLQAVGAPPASGHPGWIKCIHRYLGGRV